MRKSFVRTAIAAFTLLVMLVQGTWVLAGTTGSISGSIVSNNGAPVSGATVAVASPSQTANTTTNAQGKFSFASLAPDTYTVSVSQAGIEDIRQNGVTVTADQDQRLNLTASPRLQTIGRVSTRSNTELVKAGTIQDVYTVNPALQNAVQGFGGGGSLNQAYSAISSVPGVYVPQGQQGWAQSVYIRGGNYTSLGYEYDGIPTQRAFDAYPGGTVTALGQQELQIYTGSAPADASSTGLAGFINQVIKTGTSPLTKTLTYGIGGPAKYHKGQVEIGGATPGRAFSYYLGAATYTQDFRYGDQFNGAGYTDQYGGFFGNVVKANCGDPAMATAGCYSSFNPNSGYFDGPNGFSPLPFNAGFNNRNVASEFVGNFHIAVPQKSGNRDDIQILYNNSFNRGVFNEGLASLGSQSDSIINGTGTFAGQPYGPCSDAVPVNPNACGLNDPYTPTYRDSYRYTGPVGAALTPNGINNVVQFLQPKSPQHVFGAPITDPNFTDQQDIQSSVVKLQYQKNFGTDSYLRLYGYTFFTEWINGNGGPFVPIAFNTNALVGFNSPNYDLISHERGLSALFAKQFSDKHLVNVIGSYVTAKTIRQNDSSYTSPTNPVAVLVDSTNPTNGICYNAALAQAYCGSAARYSLPAINVNQPFLSPSKGAPVIGTEGALTCGGGPCEYFTVDTGAKASYNTVQPKFTTLALSDNWKPNDRLSIDLALKFERYEYDLPDSATPASYGFPVSSAARTLYDTSYNLFHCFSPTAGISTIATPGGACPAGSSPVNFSTLSPSSITYAQISPRLGATYQANRENVFRFSAGKYVQPTNTAYTQYNYVQANNAAAFVPLFYGQGYHNPSRDVRPEKSYNFDLSWEHQLHGTDTSFKLTPFLRSTKDEQDQVLIDPVTQFVTAINVGEKRVSGVEFQLRKGDFARNGLAGQLSYTYTDAKLKFKPLPSGGTALDGVNNAINTYNAFTKTGGGAPCYAAGTPDPTCAAGSVANPYYNAPTQALFDPNASYVPYNQLPGLGLGGVASSYVIPHVASLALNYRHDKFAITPTFQFAAGGKYGAPTNGYGIDPTSCGSLGTAPDAQRYPYGAAGGTAYDASTCAASLTVPDRFTGKFDNFGAFTEPAALTMNMQFSYDLSKRVTVTLLATNIYNRCFGGDKEPWTNQGDGKVNCWYTSPSQFTGNFFNPGSTLQTQFAYPYSPSIGNVFQSSYGGQANPFNLFLNIAVKL